MSGVVRVFVDGAALDVPATATALDAVRAWNVAAASAVERGERAIADSRGLPLPVDAPLHGGAILRLVRASPAPPGS